MILLRQVIKMLKKEILELDKETMDLEFRLICDFIKLRHELGLTQQQMAEESGTLREIIAVLETRKKTPQITTLIKLLKPFGYTIGIKKIEEEIDEPG